MDAIPGPLASQSINLPRGDINSSPVRRRSLFNLLRFL